jgi:hypothetical protein
VASFSAVWAYSLALTLNSNIGGAVKIGIIHSMPFEYDRHKSGLNRAKHGIDFDDAQALWDDEAFLEIPARNLDETRFLVIGKIKGSIGRQ